MKNIKEDKKLNVLNHSCAHLLAHAVKRIYPDAKLWVGPVIDSGFYYDIDMGDKVITHEDLEKISKEMKKIVKSDKLIKRAELSKSEALDKFKDNEMKEDLINEMPEDEIISVYQQDEFMDLCRGPHVEKTKLLKNFKLLKVSGAYYKGDSKNKMLQRIYGICFDFEEELNDHLELLEEAKKRDHRKLGRELDLFHFEKTAPGMPYWHPKGLKMFNTLVNFWRKLHEENGYQEFAGPQLNSSDLWKTSGHWDHYKEDMFILEDSDGVEQALKPMSCPNAIHMYQLDVRSYKDLPIRFNDIDVIHRNEKAGSLHGMLRVRMFRQDDSHNFVREDQIKKEINNILDLADILYGVFGIEYIPTLATRPEDFMGSIEVWDKAEKDLKEVLEEKFGAGNYIVNEGDGAFYGPKIDLMMRDALGREWQTGTIQLDFQLPKRFDLAYIDNTGAKVSPVIIHRTLYGSVERFIGIMTEHFAGAFPLWISPLQVNIIPVNNEHHLDYSNKFLKELADLNVRVELDSREEKMGYKIRESQMKKVPYTIVIGDKELENNTITFRKYNSDEQVTVDKNEFISKILSEIKDKSIN